MSELQIFITDPKLVVVTEALGSFEASFQKGAFFRTELSLLHFFISITIHTPLFLILFALFLIIIQSAEKFPFPSLDADATRVAVAFFKSFREN